MAAAVGRCDLTSVVVPALSIAVGGFVMADPLSGDHDLASVACVVLSLVAFKAGLLLMCAAVAGVPLPPVYVQFLKSVAVSASVAVLILQPFPTAVRPSVEFPALMDVEDAIAGCPASSFANKLFFPLFLRNKINRALCF